MRDDFSEDVKRALASRVGNRCSNPDCRALTSGPQEDSAKAVNVGVAAHITAASPGGPRYDDSLSAEERRHPNNGIWMCQNCAKLVDSDPQRYSADLLGGWKARAEEAAHSQVGKTAAPPTATPGRLRVELPKPVNPVGHQSAGGTYVSTWSVKVRLVAEGQPLDIVDCGLTEDGVGDWIIDEVFWEKNGRPVGSPIPVERSTEFWIRARSPKTFNTKPVSVGRLTIRFRDHTQPLGRWHEYVVEEPPRA